MKKKTSRYNGRNIYGQSCISKCVILRKETAMKQYFDALEDIEAHKGERVEYTFVLAADVPPREAEMLLPADGQDCCPSSRGAGQKICK